MQSEQIEALEKALAKYKAEKQLLVCIEELSELIKAITKVKRYPDEAGRLSNVIEEVADVIICIEYLKMIYDITQEQIDNAVEKKIRRTKSRLESIDF